MEARLCYWLMVRNIETYYPHLIVKPVNPRSRVEKPFFPGYLFACLDLEAVPLSKIAWIPGMHRIVSFDGEPAWVPDHLISSLKKQVESANLTDKVRLCSLKQGDPVKIQGGPFAGYEAIFDTRINGSERVRVLISYLQHHQISVDVPASQLAYITVPK